MMKSYGKRQMLSLGLLASPDQHSDSTTGHGGERAAQFFPHRPDGLGRYWHRRTPSGSWLAKADRSGSGPSLHFE